MDVRRRRQIAALRRLRAAFKTLDAVDDAREELPNVIWEAVSNCPLSIRELANECGVSPSTLTRWMNGDLMPSRERRDVLFSVLDAVK